MFESWLTALRGEIRGQPAFESVRALSGFHRVQASPGLDQAAEWVAEQLERRGVLVELERVPADGHTRLLGQPMPQGWACERATADLIDGRHRERLCDVTAEPLSVILRSDPARGRYPLVAVESGLHAADYAGRDVRGRVVLAYGDVHRVYEQAVLARGAAGLVTDVRRLVHPVRGPSDETTALNYTSFWWVGDEPRGWGFVVSPCVGDALRARLAAGATLELEVELESRRFDTTIPVLSGSIPGRSAEEVLIVSHLCHPRPSANDNASGAAANLEAACALAAVLRRDARAPLQRGLRFLWVPELTGTCAFLGRDPSRAARIVGAVNLDMVGEDQNQCGSTFLLEHPPAWRASFAESLLAEIRAQAADWVMSYSGPGYVPMTRMAEVPFGGGSDHLAFIDPSIGVPCPMLIQWPDRFYHSNHDTLDRVAPESLALAARCAATYAAFLAHAGPAEAAWLEGLVGRRSRRSILAALDRPDPGRHVELEALRGDSALMSLERLGVSPERIEAARRELTAFVARETRGVPPVAAARAERAGPRPRRTGLGPLGFMNRLLPGWPRLAPEIRDAWRRRQRATNQADRIADLAWLACDGQRSLDQILHLVWLESGTAPVEFVGELFELTERLGLSECIDPETPPCNPRAPATAGR